MVKTNFTDRKESKMDHHLTNGELPLGLGMAFAQNTAAMEKFIRMTEAQRKDIVNLAHNMNSKEEMASFVQKIADGTMAGIE